ncbi:MAG: ergothioneine biosynthesis protein EgtB [Sphingomonadales bacterium]|nr:ergothioneine biosynthesis protein EgtB [Sphingomonadales bacterium]MDE2170127.1 ergothioneine biosynthesis protein EgtB [Sphingomonadales bacterium]
MTAQTDGFDRNSSPQHKKPGAEHAQAALPDLYRHVRARSVELIDGLSDADATVQSMPDASPAKWHLAHTSWFFEIMVLHRFVADYAPFDPRFDYLFNSYYDSVGERHPRPARGLLSRPTLDEVLTYRGHVDAAMAQLLRGAIPPQALALIELGCHHEQQHQELLLTDILHLFAANPLRPAYRAAAAPLPASDAAPLRFASIDGGMVEIGADGTGFSFDAEGPRHTTFIEPFDLATRLVTNREWQDFIEDGGYEDPRLWLSDGWAMARAQNWRAPLYWEQREGQMLVMTLEGMQLLQPDAPVSHVSYYEADAFASWSGMRLPSEFEWELAAGTVKLDQMFGAVWQWTRSAFAPYPRFRASSEAVGEYNGKFMSGQYVLRGSSLATPEGHSRPSYRNFFPPHARWQFTGLRLTRDGQGPI